MKHQEIDGSEWLHTLPRMQHDWHRLHGVNHTWQTPSWVSGCPTKFGASSVATNKKKQAWQVKRLDRTSTKSDSKSPCKKTWVTLTGRPVEAFEEVKSGTLIHVVLSFAALIELRKSTEEIQHEDFERTRQALAIAPKPRPSSKQTQCLETYFPIFHHLSSLVTSFTTSNLLKPTEITSWHLEVHLDTYMIVYVAHT